MNSQFKNSNLGFYLYALIIFVVAAVSILIFWFMLSGYRLGTYSENTILGSVYLGGLHEEEVDAKINTRIETWLGDETIVFELTYQGYSYEFDRELFYFNLPLSKDILKNGQTNELVAQYQDSGTDRQDTINEIKALPFLVELDLENIDLDGIDGLINDILNDAGLMKTFSSKNIEDYFIDVTLSTDSLGSVDFHVPDGVNVDELVASINLVYGDEYIDINSKELFDIVEELGSELNDAEMTILSSSMLTLLLETNFSIHEVHYRSFIETPYTIEDYPYYGSNAYINENENLGYSFSFYNPNNSDFMFKIEKIDEGNARISLMGLPFVNTITASVIKTEIDYITQETNDDTDLQQGINGVIVVVERTILDLEGEEIYSKQIIFEFYPPKKEIILEPLS